MPAQTDMAKGILSMSALPPIADINWKGANVCFVPRADIRPKFVDPDQYGLIIAGVHLFNAARSMAT
jgi:hypothetical protein